MSIQPLSLLAHNRPTRGFLFIGDPHVWSRKPGRRRDTSFTQTILHKIELAAKIANELDLWPICPGDLLHDDEDQETQMLIPLSRVLQKFDRKMICLVGNHDKDEAHLSERNALLLLGVVDQLHLIDHSGFFGAIQMESENGEQKLVGIGGTPYGHPIPQDVASFLGADFDPKSDPNRACKLAGVDTIVWMTHDDLAFQGAYPGAKPIEEIRGVATCMNGHMHGTAMPHLAGMTAWYNPGNITRMSVDTKDHLPSVWQWSPFETDEMATQQGLRVPLLRQHVLDHVEGSLIFDLEGTHATAIAPTPLAGIVQSSAFAQRLLSDRLVHRSDDGVFTRESLEDILAVVEAPEQVKEITRRLQEEAAERIGARE